MLGHWVSRQGHYPGLSGGSNVLTRVLTGGRRRGRDLVMEARGWSEGRRGGSPGTQVAPWVLEIQGNRLTPVAPRRNAALPTPGFSTSDLLTSGAARE